MPGAMCSGKMRGIDGILARSRQSGGSDVTHEIAEPRLGSLTASAPCGGKRFAYLPVEASPSFIERAKLSLERVVSSALLGSASSRETSSRVRARSGAGSRAERRVEEYLRVLGLTDATRIAVLRAEIATSAQAAQTAEAPELRKDDDEEGDARRAVA